MHKITPQNLYLTNSHNLGRLLNFGCHRTRISENLATDFIQFRYNLWCHSYALPVLRHSYQHGINQFQTRLFRIKPGDNFRPASSFFKSPLQKIRRPNISVMRFGKFKMSQRFLKVFFQTLHRRRIQVFKSLNQTAAFADSFLVTFRIKDLLNQCFHFGRRRLWQFSENVTHFVNLTSLTQRLRKHFSYCLTETGVTVVDYQKRRFKPPFRDIVQKGKPGIVTFSLPQSEMKQNLFSVGSYPVSTQNPFFLARSLPQCQIYPVKKKINDVMPAQITLAPSIKLGNYLLGDFTYPASGNYRSSENIQKRFFNIVGGKSPDIHLRYQFVQYIGTVFKFLHQLRMKILLGIPHLRNSHLQDTVRTFEIPRFVSIAVAEVSAITSLIMGPAKKFLNFLFQCHLDHIPRSQSDKTVQRVRHTAFASNQNFSQGLTKLLTFCYPAHSVRSPFCPLFGWKGGFYFRSYLTLFLYNFQVPDRGYAYAFLQTF